VDTRLRVGAIDGLRAIAVLAVVVYHLWPDRLPSGFLGVDVFMVVSGFLITGLLVAEYEREGRIRLAAFWGRRARRLVPAALLLIAVVALWVRATGADTIAPTVRSQGLAAIFYVTNWRLIADGVTYGGQFAGESPLVHLWSLAVEEQFYLCWPPLLVAAFLVARGRRGPALMLAGVGMVGSAVLMGVLYESGADTARVYYGTDTRAQAFLAGCAAALALPYLGAGARRAVSAVGAGALAAVFTMMATDAPALLYRGGFAVVAVGTACACIAATGAGAVRWCLDRVALRGIGRISYGIYLWHWPAIVLLTPERVGARGPVLTLLRVAVTATGAVVSWILVERPLHGVRLRRFVPAAAAGLAAAIVALAPLSATATVAYADYRTDRIRTPVVVEPPRVRRPPAAPPSGAPAARFALPLAGTVMIVGDSGMYSATPAFSAAFRAAGWTVVETAYPGIGLTQPEGQMHAWEDAVRAHGVDLTIVMLGGWDVGWVREHGADAFGREADRAVGAFGAAGGSVLWLSVLPGGRVDDRELEPTFSALAERHPGIVEYLDIEAALRSPEGGWPQVVAGRRLRGPDGWHLCPDGAAAVTQFALVHLGLDPPAWADGPWRADPSYHDPPGVCDP